MIAYSSVNNITGVLNPVDRICVTGSDLGLLFSLTAPLLLDVPKLVVRVED